MDWPDAGPIDDRELQIIKNGGILVSNGLIEAIERSTNFAIRPHKSKLITQPTVALPGLSIAHAHLFLRFNELLIMLLGWPVKAMKKIAKAGGGILDTVAKTRAASKNDLVALNIGTD